MIVGDRDVAWCDGDGWQPSDSEVGAEMVSLPSEGGVDRYVLLSI